MAQPWKTIDRIDTAEGVLELRQRGAKDFLITVGGLVLMNSLSNRSEVVLGELGCRQLRDHAAPRVLVGGLGMGFTLRAVLDCLPAAAQVVVAELNPVVVQWCRGPLALLTDNAVSDPRVTVAVGDVAELVRETAHGAGQGSYAAVVFDLYKGPHHKTDKVYDPLYGSRAIAHVHALLKAGGLFTVWGENYDEGFDKRLRNAGFSTSHQRPGRGGYRHMVFIAEKRQGKAAAR
ncbi:MAG: spermidine synthase [Desulfuromonadales bacterium]|nr:spermidine synthase [Desulfuromonadales bacterium]